MKQSLRIRKNLVFSYLFIILMVICCSVGQAANPASWSFDITSGGQDVFWTSPSFVDTGYPQYNFSFDIVQITWILGPAQALSTPHPVWVLICWTRRLMVTLVGWAPMFFLPMFMPM